VEENSPKKVAHAGSKDREAGKKDFVQITHRLLVYGTDACALSRISHLVNIVVLNAMRFNSWLEKDASSDPDIQVWPKTCCI